MGDSIDVLNNLFWLGNVLLDILIDMLDLAISPAYTTMMLSKSRKMVNIALNALDLPVILYFLRYHYTGAPIIAGFCGALYSLICLTKV